MKTFIYVNRGAIENNRRARLLGMTHPLQPPFQVWHEGAKQNIECFAVEVEGPSKLVYSPDHQLVPHNDVVLAIVTESPVKVTK